MTTLDEIQARSDRMAAALYSANPRLLGNPSHEDRVKLVAALRAVEAAMDALDTAREMGTVLTYGQIQRAIRTAIREVLGE